MKKILIPFLMMCGVALADPPESRTIDFSFSAAPSLQVYSANLKTYTWTVNNAGRPVNLTGYTPYMDITPSNRAAFVITAACVIATATSGTFTAVLNPSSLNTNGSWIYGVGLTSNGNTTARQGSFVIIPDPYAQGAGPQHFGSTINWALYSYANTTNGPYLAGSNITFGAANSNGQVTINGSAITETDPVWTAAASDVPRLSTGGNFLTRPTVNGTNVLLQGEASAQTNQVYVNNAGTAKVANALSPSLDITNSIGGTPAATVVSGAAAGADWAANSNSVFWLDGRYAGGRSAWGGVSVGNIHIAAAGASQHGWNYSGGLMTIEDSAYGASQWGTADGAYMTIGPTAYGAAQFGYVSGFGDCAATNLAAGAIQLFQLTSGQRALTTAGGTASLLLGAGTVTEKNTIVVGDGQISHGAGTISAGGGFYDNGTRIANSAAAPQTNQLAVSYATNSGTALTSSNLVGFTGAASGIITNNARPTFSTLKLGSDVTSVDGFLDWTGTSYQSYPFDMSPYWTNGSLTVTTVQGTNSSLAITNNYLVFQVNTSAVAGVTDPLTLNYLKNTNTYGLMTFSNTLQQIVIRGNLDARETLPNQNYFARCTILGDSAGWYKTNGVCSDNTCIGQSAGGAYYGTFSSTYNTSVGAQAGSVGFTCSFYTAVGLGAGLRAGLHSGTAIGTYAMADSIGTNNVGIGYNSGIYQCGNSNIFIGANAGAVAGGAPQRTNCVVLGASCTNKGSWTVNIGSAQHKVFIDGSLMIGDPATTTNILTVVQNSATDPIADSWLTYTCDTKSKQIVETNVVVAYQDSLSNVKTYRWKRIAKVSDAEVVAVMKQLHPASVRIQTNTYTRVDGKLDTVLRELSDDRGLADFNSSEADTVKAGLVAAKQALPKYAATHVGLMLDDPNMPPEICANGDPAQGLDLVAYCGYLHAALRDEINARKKMQDDFETRIKALEGKK